MLEGHSQRGECFQAFRGSRIFNAEVRKMGKIVHMPMVRAERVDTKCGSIGHMTVDEIKERTIGDRVNVTCPECGEIHLTMEEAEEAEARKISASAKFSRIMTDAEA